MTLDKAQQLHDGYLREARRRTPRLVPREWQGPVRVEEQAEAWVFVYKDGATEDPSPYEAVVVRKDSSRPFVVLGAIGRAVRDAEARLGPPRSNERWLGSGPGRYQAFDDGLVVWHEDPGIAYHRSVHHAAVTGRRCLAVVAFLDLRGFSRWARRRTPHAVQTLMSNLEETLQDAFNEDWCPLLFVKGIGDGMMIVSERDWFRRSDGHGPFARVLKFPVRPHPGHLSALVTACARVIREGRRVIPKELAIGCGLDVGEVNQVFLFGQTDYLGEPVNNAATLQRLAWDEIILSPRFASLLSRNGETWSKLPGRGIPLADQGIRIDPATCAIAMTS